MNSILGVLISSNKTLNIFTWVFTIYIKQGYAWNVSYTKGMIKVCVYGISISDNIYQ